MTGSKSRWLWLTALLAAVALVAVACGDDDSSNGESDTSTTEADSGGEGGPTGGALSGEIFISGSSTVEPISVRVQELFNDEYPDVNIAVDGPGTGDGFALFCDGETDISDASRPIKDEEAATCADNGINYVELQVGIDGLAVMTNEANDAVECVSFADLYGLTGPESTGFANWSDANELSSELGGAGSLPDAELEITGPGEESGTYDTYVEFIVDPWAEDRGQEAATRPDYSPSADDNVIIQGVTASDTSIGWVGFAFADSAQGVKLLGVDDGETGCVVPDPETIASGEYPLSRPLFIYVNTDKAADSEALSSYVDFYLADGLDSAVAEVDYVALTDEAKTETRNAWDAS